MKSEKLSRRDFLRASVMVGGGALLAACAPQPAPAPAEPEVVEVEVTREVEVEVPVKETVIVEQPAAPADVTITFLSMLYGSDPSAWLGMFEGWAEEFREETGINVKVQGHDWSVARPFYLLAY